MRTLLFPLLLLAATAASARPFVWIEAESLENAPEAAKSYRSGDDLVSGELLDITFREKEIGAMPEEGYLLRYPFTVAKAGSYDFWARLGFTIRSPFQWRIDEGEWQVNGEHNAPITNVSELGFWNPVGWSPLGEIELSRGEHTLEIKLDKNLETPGAERDDFRFVADAFAMQMGGFRPNFAFRPDSREWRDEAAIKAERNVFELPEDAARQPRTEMALDGLWQYAPYDERIATEETRTAGADNYPNTAQVHWYGLEIPGNRNDKFWEHRFAHRFLLRTFVDVPRDYQGHSFFLRFEALSLINTLFINGQKVDDFDVHYGQWRVDVSDYLRPGRKNEIMLVVKDGFYALDDASETGMLRQYVPWELFIRNQGVTNKLQWPIKGSAKTGIFDSVFLTATAGPVYVADVFVKPFPESRGEIEVDVTLRNSGKAEHRVGYTVALAHTKNKMAVAPAREGSAQIAAGEEKTFSVTFPSDGVKLWWPEDPQLHVATTTLTMGAKTVDQSRTRFGNREWQAKGPHFYLNGVMQHLRANLTHVGTEYAATLDDVLSDWRAMGQNMFRRRFQFPWHGMTPREVLTWADEAGVNVRQNAGTFDGQHASYALALRDEDGNKSANAELFENWRKQILNGVKARRNHPSVMIWELDNEIVYINGRNFGNLDVVEPEFTETSEQVMAIDPTRVTVTGGGSAGLQMQWPTYGVHYFEVADRHYPDAAYTLEPSLARAGNDDRKVWPIDFETKPIFMSETAFLHGRNAAQFAAVAGEKAFLGKARNKDAFALLHEMFGAGYRWKETGATHFWTGPSALPDDHGYHYWQPIAPLMREWDRSFGPGQEVIRTFKLFNDTRDESPITVRWKLHADGQTLAEGKDTNKVEAGESELYQITFTTPEVDAPLEAIFSVSASQNGDTVYTHDYAYRVLPASELGGDAKEARLMVWDPSGTVQNRLGAQGVEFAEVRSMADVQADYDVLIVGPNALTEELATDPMWMRLANTGKRLLVLEQEHPLHFQALPSDATPTGYDGRMSFSQNLEHPVFDGLTQHDLSFWNDDHVVYRNLYTKPTRGASSLAHADEQLGYSTTLFVPVEDSALLLTQYAIGEKLDSNVVAQTLFDNMVEYLAGYEQTARPTALVAQQGGPLDQLMSDISLDFTRVDDASAALDTDARILVVDGTKNNLRALNERADARETYFAEGGWIMVMGVTPESLDAFNELVGYEHLIRPFEMERTSFPALRDPLTAGLTLRDLVMGSGRRIQTYTRDEWPADDAFEYIVDLEDVAPFSEFPDPAYFNDPGATPGSDMWPRNMVNGFTGADHWRLGFSIHLNKGDPTEFSIELPRLEKVSGLTIQPNRIYHPITQLVLSFDEGEPVTLNLEDSEGPQSFEFEPRQTKAVHLNITDWIERGRSDVIGIDDLEILVKRPEGFQENVQPMLNIGGLNKYPRGAGGIILNQYRIAGTESNPINAEKKMTVIATLLRNLGAPFSGAKAVIAGQNLRYQPISLENAANLYLQGEQGFPNKRVDLSALPLGSTTFADVRYEVRDFSTSPLESGVTLQHRRYKSNAQSEEVRIDVNAKADALFFLQTFMQQRRYRENRRNPEPPVVFEYAIEYADGTSDTVPVQLQHGVDDYTKENPKALPNAAVAWEADVDTPGDKTQRVAVYQMQWNNPKPGTPIKSITLQYGPDGEQWGLPILLGITAAQAQDARS